MAAAATVCNAVPVNSTPRIKRRLNPCALFLKHYNPFGGRNHKSSNRGHRQSAHCLRSERCPYLSGRRAWSTTYVRFPSLFLRKAHWWTAMNHCVCVCVRRVCDTQLGQCAMRLKLVRVSLCAKRGCAISGAVPSLQCVCVCACGVAWTKWQDVYMGASLLVPWLRVPVSRTVFACVRRKGPATRSRSSGPQARRETLPHCRALHRCSCVCFRVSSC